MRLIFVILPLFFSLNLFAKNNINNKIESTKIITQDFQVENLSFDYISSDGSIWLDCKHDKGTQPHGWTVYCGKYVFKLHMFLRIYQGETDTGFEFHYWADEFENLKETHTQSTWITMDKNTKPKRVIAYLGFTGDTSQLRMEINP
jgi:hypothetical protein